MEPIKVYVVKTAFEYEGLTYAEGEKYELADSVVATLPEGSVEEFVPETPASSTPDETVTATGSSTPAPAQAAKPWVGGHTVGRE